MNSPPSIADVLDMIKERYEGSGISTVYRIVMTPTRYEVSDYPICYTEIVDNYDDLCVKLFKLDVSGWEIYGGITSAARRLNTVDAYNLVTICMARVI